MADTFDLLLDKYDRGQLNRRQLLTGVLAFATAGSALGVVQEAQAMEAPLTPAMSINHVHLNVHDTKRSMEFYSTILGAKPKATIKSRNGRVGQETMYLPGAHPGYGSWLSISQVDADKPVGIDHVGYGVTVPSSRYKEIGQEIKKRYPDLKDPHYFISSAAGFELYFFDPDGINVQIIQIGHNGEMSGFNKDTGEKVTNPPACTQADPCDVGVTNLSGAFPQK